jgi:hypothetical protein
MVLMPVLSGCSVSVTHIPLMLMEPILPKTVKGIIYVQDRWVEIST